MNTFLSFKNIFCAWHFPLFWGFQGFSCTCIEPSLFSTCCNCCLVASVVCDSLQSCGLQPARFFCSWDFPGKNTGWVAMPSSRGSSQPRDRTCVCCIASRSLPLSNKGSPYFHRTRVKSRKSSCYLSLLNFGILCLFFEKYKGGGGAVVVGGKIPFYKRLAYILNKLKRHLC